MSAPHALSVVSARRQAERRGALFGRHATRVWLISERPHLGEINRARKDHRKLFAEAGSFAHDIVHPRWEHAFMRAYVRTARSLMRNAAAAALQPTEDWTDG